jgi:hypothetical protein
MRGIGQKKMCVRVRDGTGDLFLCSSDAPKNPGDEAELRRK